MPRWLKVSLVAILAVLVAAVVLLVVGMRAVDPRAAVALVGDRVKEATGRELAVRGAVEFSLWPRIAIVAEDVAFANAPWGIRRDMLTVQRVEAKVKIRPLLSRQVEIEELRLVRPDLLLETDRDGLGNWRVGDARAPRDAAGATPAGAAEPLFPIAADRVRIEDGRVAYRDGSTAATTSVVLHNVSFEGAGGKSKLALDAIFRDQQLAIEATSDAFANWLAGPGKHPLSATILLPGGRASFEGTVESLAPPVADGKLTAELQSTVGISKLLAGSLPLPVPLRVSSKVVVREGRYAFDELTVAAREQPITGKLEVRTGGARPVLSGALHAPALDLRRSGSATPATAGTQLSVKPAAEGGSKAAPSAALLPLAVLRAVDADGSLRIDRLTTEAGREIERLSARVALANGRLQVEPFEFAVFGGTLSGRLAVDASPGKSPTLAIRASGKGLDGARMLKDFGSRISLTGAPTSVSLDVTAPADSIARLRAGASGRVVVQAGQATLVTPGTTSAPGGFEQVLGLVVPGLSRGPTRVGCAVARLELRGGVATAQRSIAIETDRMNAVVSGTIHLATEALDLAVRPSLPKGFAGGLSDLVEVVRVRGTWSDPHVAVDSLDAARAAISIGGALSSGGLSVLAQSLVKRGSDDPHPCRTALAGAGKPDAADTGGMTQGASPDRGGGRASGRPAVPAPDSLEDIGNTVRRLFGR